MTVAMPPVRLVFPGRDRTRTNEPEAPLGFGSPGYRTRVCGPEAPPGFDFPGYRNRVNGPEAPPGFGSPGSSRSRDPESEVEIHYSNEEALNPEFYSGSGYELDVYSSNSFLKRERVMSMVDIMSRLAMTFLPPGQLLPFHERFFALPTVENPDSSVKFGVDMADSLLRVEAMLRSERAVLTSDPLEFPAPSPEELPTLAHAPKPNSFRRLRQNMDLIRLGYESSFPGKIYPVPVRS